MYTRFLESLFESQTYPNENESDPLGADVSTPSVRLQSQIYRYYCKQKD